MFHKCFHARSCISPFVMNTMVGGCRKTYKHCGISKWGQANKDVRKFKFHWFIFAARDRGNLSAVLFSLRRMAWFRHRRKARDNTTDSPTVTAGPVNRRLNWNIYWWAFHWHFIRMISELLSSYSYFVAAMSLTSVISPLFLATWYSLQFIQIASVVSVGNFPNWSLLHFSSQAEVNGKHRKASSQPSSCSQNTESSSTTPEPTHESSDNEGEVYVTPSPK